MSLLNKPKRTLSNLSFQDFSKVKQICQTSFQQYRHKFHYQPDWDAFLNKTKMISNYEKKKNSQAKKILSSTHSYSVHTNKNFNNLDKEPLNDNSQKYKPLTANLLSKKTRKIEEDGFRTTKNFSELFQNQHLSSNLQINQFNTIKNQSSQRHYPNYKSLSKSIDRTSMWTKNIIRKNKITDSNGIKSRQGQIISKHLNQQKMNTILSEKENFYNPYHIGPKIKALKQIKAIKTLRNQSITQLKQLCQEERNLNFSQKISQKQNISVHQVNRSASNWERKSFSKSSKISHAESQDILKFSKIRQVKLEKKMRKQILNKARQLKRTAVTKTCYFKVDRLDNNLK